MDHLEQTSQLIFRKDFISHDLQSVIGDFLREHGCTIPTDRPVTYSNIPRGIFTGQGEDKIDHSSKPDDRALALKTSDQNKSNTVCSLTAWPVDSDQLCTVLDFPAAKGICSDQMVQLYYTQIYTL